MLPAAPSLGTGTRVLVTAAAIIVLLAGMKEAKDLLVPLVFAAFLSILAAPAVLWLEQRRVPGSVAVTLVMTVVIVVIVGLGTVLGGSVNAFVAALPRYQERLTAELGVYVSALEQFGVTVSLENLTQMVNPRQLIDLAGQAVSQVADLLSNTFLILLTMVFMLLELASFPKKIRRAMGDPEADLSRYASLITEVKRYVVFKTYISAATGVLIGVFLGFVGVDFALLWGLIAFFLNYIPNIGSIIAAVPPVVLALVQFGPGTALVTASGFVVVNAVIGNVVEPRLLGRKLGLSTLVVFLSLVFWGWLWGPMGMLLSVPLTMIVKILLESSGQFSSVAILLDQPLSQRAPPVKEILR